MPIFNELRIDETHLAKVRAVRSNVEVTEKVNKNFQEDFLKWYKGISKILSNQKQLTSCTIVHTIK
jgi:hypothetical protein